MKIVVLGASGGCGRELVAQAHAQGETVVAVGRLTSSIEVPAGVEVKKGAVDDVDFLTDCFEGADVVLSGLGLRMGGLAPWSRAEDPAFLDRATPAIVAAAKKAGVKRILAVSAGGVGDSYSAMPGVFKFFIKASSLRNAYPALDRMEQVLLGSGLDVCLPRPSGLTDEPATGAVVIATTYAGRATIPRADVAAWMLTQARAAEIAARTPLITVTGAA